MQGRSTQLVDRPPEVESFELLSIEFLNSRGFLPLIEGIPVIQRDELAHRTSCKDTERKENR